MMNCGGRGRAALQTNVLDHMPNRGFYLFIYLSLKVCRAKNKTPEHVTELQHLLSYFEHNPLLLYRELTCSSP